MNTLDLGVAIGSGGKAIGDLDALDDQYAVLGLDLPDGFDVVAGRINFDLTRLQRAGERAGQSATRCGDHVVERGGVRRISLRSDAVVLGNLRMDTEDHGSVLGREVREPLRPTEPFDPHPRDVGGVSHVGLAYPVCTAHESARSTTRP